MPIKRRAALCTLCLLYLLAFPVRAWEGRIVELVWSPDGQHLAVVSCQQQQGTVYRLDLRPASGKGFVKEFRSHAFRLVGWTPDGSALVVDPGGGYLEVYSRDGLLGRLSVPEDTFPIASDGRRFYFTSLDRSHLLSCDASGQVKVLAVLPEGTRPSGCLSPDGRLLALRRSVASDQGWSTEVWVWDGSEFTRWASLEGSFVKLDWHPDKPSLLANIPSGRSWTALQLTGKKVQTLGVEQPSPMQWDRQGYLYVASHNGLLRLKGSKLLARWKQTPALWAVSPSGKDAVSSGSPDGSLSRFQLVQP